MKLSVCIFTYNHGRFIAQAIESALAQRTSFEFEIIIGEDHSTDNTALLVQEYVKNYPQKIKAIFNPENLGLMKNHVNTVSSAKGDYIALLDGDDYWTDPLKLQKQADFLDQNPEFALCFHDASILNADGTINAGTCCGPNTPQIVGFKDIICSASIPTLTLVFNKRFLKDHPPEWFETLNAPDRPFFLLLLHHGPGHYFNECWGTYRKHPNGHWTGQHYLSQWNTHLQIFQAVNKHFDYKYQADFCRCEAKIRFYLSIDLLRDKKKEEALDEFADFLKYCIRNSALKEHQEQIDWFQELYHQ